MRVKLKDSMIHKNGDARTLPQETLYGGKRDEIMKPEIFLQLQFQIPKGKVGEPRPYLAK